VSTSGPGDITTHCINTAEHGAAQSSSAPGARRQESAWAPRSPRGMTRWYVFSQAHRRAIVQRRRQRRHARPSGRAARVRGRRGGAINAIPAAARGCSSGSLSSARSPRRRRGRPRGQVSARVTSTRGTTWGRGAAVCPASGRAAASARPMRVVPWPRVVGPTVAPPCSPPRRCRR
jgi:hypothetical protein